MELLYKIDVRLDSSGWLHRVTEVYISKTTPKTYGIITKGYAGRVGKDQIGKISRGLFERQMSHYFLTTYAFKTDIPFKIAEMVDQIVMEVEDDLSKMLAISNTATKITENFPIEYRKIDE